MDIFILENSQDVQSFTDQVVAFLAAVNSQVKMKIKG